MVKGRVRCLSCDRGTTQSVLTGRSTETYTACQHFMLAQNRPAVHGRLASTLGFMGMVFLAITEQGLKEAILLAKANNFPIWCGADTVSNAEYAVLNGLNISRFDYSLFGESIDVIQDAITTILEHHPNDERIWVETIVKF